METLLIDIRTVMLLLWLGHLIAVVLIAIYKYSSHNQEHEFPITIFLYARLAQASGWFLFWLRNLIPDIYSVLLANGLVFTGMGLEALAIESISGETRRKISSHALTITLVNVINVAIYQFEAQNLRNGFGSLVPLACFIFPSILLTFEKGASPLQRMVGSLYLVYCASTAYRSVAAFTSPTFTVLTSNNAQTFAFLALFSLAMFGSIGYLLLFKEKADRELLLAATIDPLTNIFNRRSFFKHAETAIAFAIRNNDPIVLLTIDIDDFKKINDAHGHPVGDLALRDFAAATLQFVRPYDVFGRVGGDEFMILLPKTSAGEAANVADRIQEIAKKRGVGEKEQVHYTVSIGVCSLIPQKIEDLEKMVQASDTALYRAKTSGRDRNNNGT